MASFTERSTSTVINFILTCMFLLFGRDKERTMHTYDYRKQQNHLMISGSLPLSRGLLGQFAKDVQDPLIDYNIVGFRLMGLQDISWSDNFKNMLRIFFGDRKICREGLHVLC